MSNNGLADQYGALRLRNIGPHRGGRVSAVAGHPTERKTFYFGSGGGGVWKTVNSGLIWENVSDGYVNTASVGALAVSQSNPNVVLVGMGECNIRGNVTYGDGVYRSRDGGGSWSHLGLADTRHIARIRIDPRNVDLFYVAALGHAFGPNQERGVYRTSDGGKTFERVLFVNEDTGAIDLSMDPHNSLVLYAAMWQARRQPHSLTSGGPGSGLYKTTDGGETWDKISDGDGFPKGVLGKIGVSASGGKAGRVYALVEAEEGGMVRSEDGGATWKLTSDNRSLRSRAFYYTHCISDPVSADTVYALNNFMWKSTDGGSTFTPVATPHSDNHDLWIDPRDPTRMIESNDGGANISFDGGLTWSSIYNQPTGEFYHVTTSPGFAYRVYGAQQDNSTISLPSRSDDCSIMEREFFNIGGAESGYIAVRPDDPDIVFAGSSGGGEGGKITRYDNRTHQRRDISIWPQRTRGMAAEDYKYRFQWTSPILLSPHDPNVLYMAGNHLFKSTNEGQSWEQISPDLSRNAKEKLGPSGGPITKDHTGVEVYCVIFALAESPVTPGVLWAGSDDGLVHISRDAGKTWTDITPKDLPEWTRVSIIEASPFDADTAYLAANRYQLDDTHPYVFKTTDGGLSWQSITSGIRAGDFVRVVREDPVTRGLLYLGTETGLYVSLDDGASWESLQLNLPVVSVHDLQVHGDELVIATHGRGFWVLDDVTPLRQLKEEPSLGALRLFQPKPTVRAKSDARARLPKETVWDGTPRAIMEMPAGVSHYVKEKPQPGEAWKFLDAGENPPSGVVVYYVLADEPEGPVTLTFEDTNGEIHTFSSEENKDQPDSPRVPAKKGANRFVWDLRYPDATKVEGLVEALVEDLKCQPLAVPGEYKVTLKAGDHEATTSFTILRDPRIPATDEDLKEQFALLIKVRDELSRVHQTINDIRTVRKDLESLLERAGDNEDLRKQAESLTEQLTSVEQELVQLKIKSPQDAIGLPPGLNAQIAHVFTVASSADFKPTKQTYDLFGELSEKAAQALARVRDLGKQSAALAEQASALGVPSLRLPADWVEGSAAH